MMGPIEAFPADRLLFSAFLGGARASGLIAVFPLFSLFQVTGLFQFGVAAALSLPCVIALYDAAPALLAGAPMQIAGLLAKEMAVGAGLGLALGAPFWAVAQGGAIVDQYRGANTPGTFDPVNAMDATPLSTLLPLIVTVLWVANGGIAMLVQILWSSFRFWPALSFAPVAGALSLGSLGEIVETIGRHGFLIMAPALVMLAAVDVAFLFLSRSAPQMPLFDLTASAKILVSLALCVALSAFLGQYAQDLWLPVIRRIWTILGE